MKAFADLADLPEDQRIEVAAKAAAAGNIVGVFVDDDVAADRYVSKFVAGYRVRIIDRQRVNLGSASVVFLRVGPAES